MVISCASPLFLMPSRLINKLTAPITTAAKFYLFILRKMCEGSYTQL